MCTAPHCSKEHLVPYCFGPGCTIDLRHDAAVHNFFFFLLCLAMPEMLIMRTHSKLKRETPHKQFKILRSTLWGRLHIEILQPGCDLQRSIDLPWEMNDCARRNSSTLSLSFWAHLKAEKCEAKAGFTERTSSIVRKNNGGSLQWQRFTCKPAVVLGRRNLRNMHTSLCAQKDHERDIALCSMEACIYWGRRRTKAMWSIVYKATGSRAPASNENWCARRGWNLLHKRMQQNPLEAISICDLQRKWKKTL